MTIQRFSLLNYGLLAFPIAFAGLPIYIHAPDFYATELGIPLASIGFVLLLLRVIDAIQDPIIGTLSDRFHRQRFSIVLIGIVLLGVGFWMVFHPNPAYPLTWLAVSMIVCTTGFSITIINLQAAGGLWRVSSEERTRVASVREALGLIGLLAASVIPAVLVQRYQPAHAFHLLTLLYLPILGACAFVFFRWLRDARLARPESSLPITFSELWNTAWLRRFMLVYGLSTFASSIPGVLVLFFIRDHLQAEEQTGLFLLLYFLSGALAMPLWQKIARKRSKHYAWCMSMALACLTFVWAFMLAPGDIWAFAAICLLSGIAFGADLALPPAIIADHIAIMRHERAASRYYALLAFFSKAALALATGIMLPALGLAGYQPGHIDHSGALPIAYALIPCMIKLSAALLLMLSPILTKGENHEKNLIRYRSRYAA
ncbi:MAG: MFS transporter [Rickettsiales bacterium]|jgi:GPH family glycoside/pentoside/hexuronide:cation symporter|nr:MFS transporter [Rickettsiales bacterium]